MPQSKDDMEKEESGPDKLPQDDVLYKTRSTKEYSEKIEKEKVAKVIGMEQAEKISRPLIAKLQKKFRSKSQERKRKAKKCKRPNKKRDRKNSVNITIQKEENNDLRRNRYKNKASNFDSIISQVSDYNESEEELKLMKEEIEVKQDNA
jgi:hypothetical protein